MLLLTSPGRIYPANFVSNWVSTTTNPFLKSCTDNTDKDFIVAQNPEGTNYVLSTEFWSSSSISVPEPI